MMFESGTAFEFSRLQEIGQMQIQIQSRRQTRPEVPRMEGMIARWYARMRGSAAQLAAYRGQAAQLSAGLATGGAILEVAPGPGNLAIELARLGRYHVAGVDISRSFVEIASASARRADVSVDFRRGDAANLPFPAESFDLVVCQAAFKNFAQPVVALDEMHRVLRPGGTAVIQDMRREATDADIDQEIERMQLGRLNAFMTRVTLRVLRRRAFSRVLFERLAAQSAFGTCRAQEDGMSIEVRLTKGSPGS
jgi:ubiquinone/menaquinone biosynthesis C-methylase UbiE